MTQKGWTDRVRQVAALLLVAMALELLTYWWPIRPPELPPGLPAEAVQGFQQAEAYLQPLLIGRIFSSLMSILAVALLWVSGLAERVEARFGSTRLRWPARIGFLLAAFGFFWMVYMPSSVFAYLHNRSFGITGMVWAAFWRNSVLGTLVPLLIYLCRYLMVFCLIGIFKRSWWWVGAIFLFVVFSAVPEWFSRTYPLDPLEKMKPLPAGEIRDAFEALAKQTGRNLELMMTNESERTRLVNMALTGRIGREYVMVTDTLLEKLTADEARVMLAHELAHDKTRRLAMPINKALGLLNMLVVLGLVYWAQKVHPVPDRLILTVLVEIMLAGHFAGYVLGPFSAPLSRYEEREADRYALEITQDPESFRSLLLKLAAVNLEPYDAPKWAYHLYGASHPTIRERLAMADAWKPSVAP